LKEHTQSIIQRPFVGVIDDIGPAMEAIALLLLLLLLLMLLHFQLKCQGVWEIGNWDLGKDIYTIYKEMHGKRYAKDMQNICNIYTHIIEKATVNLLC
jgi:hypothetical protein